MLNEFPQLFIIIKIISIEVQLMSYVNPFQNTNSGANAKLSLIYIEQVYFHRIQVKSISSLYKLSVKLKKPIILSLHSLPVLKYIIEHNEVLNSIFQMQNIHEIKICVSGYGIFNQKYELQQVSKLFLILGQYCKNLPSTLKKVILQLPGWRTINNEVITNIFKFIKKCQCLQQFSLNINHAMSLQSENNQKQGQKNERQLEQQTFYGIKSFKTQQFDLLMKYISSLLPKSTLIKLELRFGVWQGVNTAIIQILIESLKKIYERIKNLKIVKIDLNGWGIGNYSNPQLQISMDSIEQMFRTIQQFDGQQSELLEIDMRNWPSKFKINKYKQKFQFLCALSKKKEQVNGNTNIWNVSGTNFYGSSYKGKGMTNRMKVEIRH